MKCILKCSIVFVTICLLMLSCNNNPISHSGIKIDLDHCEDSIFYSAFAKNLEYIELNTNDSCILSDIERIYMDDDTIIILDNKGAGVLVFTSDGKFINQIDCYGGGPMEFVDITAATIDPVLNNICIWDYAGQKINKYTYEGGFIKSYKNDSFVRDFAVLKDEVNLCFLPFYCQSIPYGVWTSDTDNRIIKKIDVNVPKDDQVEFTGTYYNLHDQGIYYYDRNWDRFSFVSKDTLALLYTFDVKQKLSEELRKKDPATLLPFKNIARMSNFSNSNNYILLSYYCYGENNTYKWVLLDKNNDKISISKNIYNDIDYIETDYHHIYHLNDSTWCRVIETDANDCNTLLQIIKLK